jgi:hypothetical protein
MTQSWAFSQPNIEPIIGSAIIGLRREGDMAQYAIGAERWAGMGLGGIFGGRFPGKGIVSSSHNSNIQYLAIERQKCQNVSPLNASPSSSRPRTPRFQCGNTGSNPVGDATDAQQLWDLLQAEQKLW